MMARNSEMNGIPTKGERPRAKRENSAKVRELGVDGDISTWRLG